MFLGFPKRVLTALQGQRVSCKAFFVLAGPKLWFMGPLKRGYLVRQESLFTRPGGYSGSYRFVLGSNPEKHGEWAFPKIAAFGYDNDC